MLRLQLVTASLFVTSAVCTANQPERPNKYHWNMEVRWGFHGLFNPVAQFENVPPDLRTVPYYGSSVSSAGLTIPDHTVSPAAALGSVWAFANDLDISGRLKLRVGVSFSALAKFGIDPGNTGNIRSIDVQSKVFERGEGKSLIYYGLRQSNKLLPPKPFGEIELPVNNWVSLLVGAPLLPHSYNYDLERGWDRHDNLETFDRRPFCKIRTYTPYAGVRVGFFDEDMFGGAIISAGPILSTTEFNPIAQGATVKSGNGFMFSITFGAGGAVKKF
jgi:hypothetical protein